MSRRTPAALLLLLVLAAPTGAEELAGLAGLRDVRLGVDVEHPLDGMTEDDLLPRLREALRRAEPPITVAGDAADRVRLTVSVRATSATTLRGFWLPFSGTYGVGAVRLAVERAVTRPGVPGAFPAIVWQTHRIVGASWDTTPAEITRALDAMVLDLGAARGRAR